MPSNFPGINPAALAKLSIRAEQKLRSCGIIFSRLSLRRGVQNASSTFTSVNGTAVSSDFPTAPKLNHVSAMRSKAMNLSPLKALEKVCDHEQRADPAN